MSKHLMLKLGRAFDYAADLLAYSAGCAIICIVICISIEVLSRSIFNRPILGIAEIAEYLVLYMTFMGATWVQKLKAHVRMDIIVERVNPRARSLLNTFTCIAGGVVLMAISFYAATYAYDAAKQGVHTITPLEFPVAVLVAILSIGCFVLSIQFLRDAYNEIKIARMVLSEKSERYG